MAEKWRKSALTDDEVVHYVNGNKLDNRPENLIVLTRAQHSALHTKLDNPNPKLTDGRWSKKWQACRHCGTIAEKHYAQGYCEACYRALRRHRRAK